MDALQKFEAAEQQFNSVDRRLNQLTDVLRAAVHGLAERRHKFTFANVSGPGLPAEVMLGQHVSIDANDWRTPAQIQTMVADWHKAKDELGAAWRGLPDSIRNRMTPPPVLTRR